VDNSARDTPCHFGLNRFQRFGGLGLLARRNRRLDLLDEGPDPADSRMVDRGAVRTAVILELTTKMVVFSHFL
jgi:hypothetical protein